MRMIRAPFGRTSQDRHSYAATHSVWKRKVWQLEKAGPPDILPFTYTFVPLHKVLTPLLVAAQNILELFSLNSIKKKKKTMMLGLQRCFCISATCCILCSYLKMM